MKVCKGLTPPASEKKNLYQDLGLLNSQGQRQVHPQERRPTGEEVRPTKHRSCQSVESGEELRTDP